MVASYEKRKKINDVCIEQEKTNALEKLTSRERKLLGL